MQNLGIEIGGTKLQLVLGDKDCQITDRRRLTVDRHAGAVGIRAAIERTLPELLRPGEVGRIGVGFGGPVDWRSGRICRSHQIEGWSEFDLSGWLHQLTSLPVVVDNDANVAALGESLCGAGRGYDPLFYVTLGSGVGGGMVTGGVIYHGAIPGEAEIGHVRLDRQGSTVESRCSGWAVDKKVKAACAREPAGRLASLAAKDPGGEARHLATALQEVDPTAVGILRETAGDLAFGLSHVMHLFHPQLVVLGGGLARLGEPLRAAVEQALRPQVMDAFASGVKVALAELGEDSVPVGALALARDISAPH